MAGMPHAGVLGVVALQRARLQRERRRGAGDGAAGEVGVAQRREGRVPHRQDAAGEGLLRRHREVPGQEERPVALDPRALEVAEDARVPGAGRAARVAQPGEPLAGVDGRAVGAVRAV
jgi:hypothetical protein